MFTLFVLRWRLRRKRFVFFLCLKKAPSAQQVYLLLRKRLRRTMFERFKKAPSAQQASLFKEALSAQQVYFF